MSRRIAVDLYNALVALRPGWASAKADDADAEKVKACVVKVVMTGSADHGPGWQPHIRSKDKRRKLTDRFKDAKDPFRIVIVPDMWLTGFNAPCLHTMYADKPMQSHGLMQAIARPRRNISKRHDHPWHLLTSGCKWNGHRDVRDRRSSEQRVRHDLSNRKRNCYWRK